MPVNETGRSSLAKFCQTPGDILLLDDACKAATKAPADTVLFVMNAQAYINEARPAQAVSNLRECFKERQNCLVLLAPQIDLPACLRPDVITLDEPLPDAAQLRAIVKKTHEEAGVEYLPEVGERAVEAVQGLSAFQAEQTAAMSFDIGEVNGKMKVLGLNVDDVWERKRKQVEQTKGLSINREGMNFADLGGLEVAKQYMLDMINGNDRPNAIIFVDEIEKVMAGASGDTSGVSQDQHRTLLTHMQDRKSSGVLLVGHPGSGKSAIAKAIGNEAGIPTITLDLGATKGGIVGESESQLRDALKVIDAVSNGKALWIATSNGIASISPELKRRFKDGIFFTDLPDAVEKAAIWKVHREAYGIERKDVQPDDTGWTGAEIEQCCRKAWQLNSTLAKAGRFIVPVSQSAPDKIEALRQQAHGRWLSASHEGVYNKDQEAEQIAVAKPAQRKIKAE